MKLPYWPFILEVVNQFLVQSSNWMISWWMNQKGRPVCHLESIFPIDIAQPSLFLSNNLGSGIIQKKMISSSILAIDHFEYFSSAESIKVRWCFDCPVMQRFIHLTTFRYLQKCDFFFYNSINYRLFILRRNVLQLNSTLKVPRRISFAHFWDNKKITSENK